MITRLSKISLIGIVFIFTICPAIFADCPPGYPIDCGNGWCCPLSHPVCGAGAYEGQCFSFATTTIPGGCPLAVVLENDETKLNILRLFRDSILSQTPEGQEIIRLYYQWSPAIVKAMEEDEEFKQDVKEMIDGVLGLIEEETE